MLNLVTKSKATLGLALLANMLCTLGAADNIMMEVSDSSADHEASEQMKDAFKAQIRTWRGTGVDSLRNIFQTVAEEGLAMVSSDEDVVSQAQLLEVAALFGIDSSDVDNFSGSMSTDEFVYSLIEPLSSRSLSLVDKIWLQLDVDRVGVTSGDVIRQLYDGTVYNEGSEYFGTYTDPNHVGSERIVTLLDEKDAEDGKRIISVLGLGGEGEPDNFVLPGWLSADDGIVIDFSPKGGPKDFAGTWDSDGIKFTLDGNKWPQLAHDRDAQTTDYLKKFDDVDFISKTEFGSVQQDMAQSFADEDAFISYLSTSWSTAE